MRTRCNPRRAGALALGLVALGGVFTPAAAAPAPPAGDGPGVLPEQTVSTRLADRRSFVSGDRMYVTGDASGQYPAAGFHIRGEMGGFWAPPFKLLDGLWFGLDGKWLGTGVPATRYASGTGYETFRYAGANGLSAQRTQFVPDGAQATLIGLTLAAPRHRTVTLTADAHSELLPAYPWTSTTPTSTELDARDTASAADGGITFRDQGTANARHDYAAVVRADRTPATSRLGRDHRGPQDPPVRCAPTGDAPYRCDDSTGGKGTGGGLDYRIDVGPQPRTVWFAVGGSEHGPAAARDVVRAALRDPQRALAAKIAARRAVAARTRVDLPGDRLLQRSIEWSKQNLADSVQESRDLDLREVNAGKNYPAPVGTLKKARFFGAGFPDYPWLFGTDGEYTAFAGVAAGDFDTVRAHLRALRDISDTVNRRSGKIVHEVVSTGDVFFGANADDGNTDESAKFPSMVALLWRWSGRASDRDEFYDAAVRALRHIARDLDADHDGWPEGLGNVETGGMGVEKLDNTVYYLRGLRDLADLARSKGDRRTASWATSTAENLQRRFDAQWWAGPDAAGYAESIDLPDAPANDNTRIFQRHWTGVTPMEVVLRGSAPLVGPQRADVALDRRERPCYTGEFGLFHTGTGPTSAPGGNPGPSCDGQVSSVPSLRDVFSLNTAIMAVAEGNYGRSARHYTDGNARIQLDPAVVEKPGAMPEIAPSPQNGANIDRPFTDRSMVVQAWGTYGTLWPVVHQQLGVDPDLGRGELRVVPLIPAGQNRIAGQNIRLGTGAVAVTARRDGRALLTDFRLTGPRLSTVLGSVLPAGAHPATVTLDGHRVAYRTVHTTRGTEILVHTTATTGRLRVIVH